MKYILTTKINQSKTRCIKNDKKEYKIVILNSEERKQ